MSLLLIYCLCAPVFGQTAPDSPKAVAVTLENLGRFIDVISAIDIEVHDEVLNQLRENTPAKSATADDHYIQTLAGQRRLLNIISNDAAKGQKQLHCFDGQKAYTVRYEDTKNGTQVSYGIRRVFSFEDRFVFSDMPLPLRYFYLEHTPISQKIKQSNYMGTKEILKRKCDLFLLKAVKTGAPKPNDSVYYIDQETGTLLSVRRYLDQQAVERDAPFSIWEALVFEKVDGIFFPTQSRETTFRLDGEGKTVGTLTRTSTVKRCEFNKKFDISLFQPPIEPGARVSDELNKKTWIEPGLPKVAEPSKDTESKTIAANSKVEEALNSRIDPPTPTGQYLAYGIVGASLVSLVAIALIKRKRS